MVPTWSPFGPTWSKSALLISSFSMSDQSMSIASYLCKATLPTWDVCQEWPRCQSSFFFGAPGHVALSPGMATLPTCDACASRATLPTIRLKVTWVASLPTCDAYQVRPCCQPTSVLAVPGHVALSAISLKFIMYGHAANMRCLCKWCHVANY